MRRCDGAFLAALVASLLVLAAFGPLEQRIAKIGGDDFSTRWAGPRALVMGHDPYDTDTWYESAVGFGAYPPDVRVYLYPPWVAVALVPLGVLPLPLATAVWTIGGLGAAAVALWLLCRAYIPGHPVAHAAAATTLVLSGPAVSNFLSGQWSWLFIAALSGIVLALRAERPVLAGLLSLAMLGKPPLFLFAPPALALRALWPSPGRDRRPGVRFVLVGAGAGITAIVASALIVPSWWPAWPATVGAAQLGPQHVTVPGLLFRVIGDPGLFIAAGVLLGLVAIGLAFHPRGPAWIPVWLTLSILATPYANPYDLLVLLVPLVMAAGVVGLATRRGAIVFGGGIAILLVGATLLHDLGQLTYAPLVPLSIFALMASALWDRRRETEDRGI